MMLLFVCTGNTCRSPLAWAAWQAFGAPVLRGTTLEGHIRVYSAGLSAANGVPVSPHAVAVAREWGVDLSRHRARALTPDFASRVDLGVCMTPAHREAMRWRVASPERARLLGEFANTASCEQSRQLARLMGDLASTTRRDLAIADPIGGSREAYAACAAQIRAGVEGLARALRDNKL